jgi:hypothetical protein
MQLLKFYLSKLTNNDLRKSLHRQLPINKQTITGDNLYTCLVSGEPVKRKYFGSSSLLMAKSDDICNDANKHYLCQHTTEKCANNDDNANNETKIRKGETTKIASK